MKDTKIIVFLKHLKNLLFLVLLDFFLREIQTLLPQVQLHLHVTLRKVALCEKTKEVGKTSHSKALRTIGYILIKTLLANE